MDALGFEFQGKQEYWVTFRDGSRVKVEAYEDGSGNVDILNEDLAVLVNVTSPDGPVNRDFIEGVERIPYTWDQGAIVKHGMRETATMEFMENVALERDCE